MKPGPVISRRRPAPIPPAAQRLKYRREMRARREQQRKSAAALEV